MRKLILACLPFIFFSCSTVEKITDNTTLIDDLISNEWVLESLNGGPVNADDYMKGLPSLLFKEDGGVQGSTGCNSFSGKFALGDELKLDPGAMTKMNCPGTGELDFLNALQSSTSIDVVKDDLVLKNAADELLRFTPAND